MIRYVLTSFALLLSVPLAGQSSEPVLHLADSSFTTLDMTPYAVLWTDPAGEMTIEEIRTGNLAFTPGIEEALPTPYPMAHWLRVNVTAGEAIHNRWLVFKSREKEYPYLAYIDYVDAYVVKDGAVREHYRTGQFVPRREKAVKEKAAFNALPFSMQAGDSLTLYLRLGTAQRLERLHVSLELVAPAGNLVHTADWSKWDVYGAQAMYFIIGFYVLVFWFFVRHNAYLYFGLYCLLFGLHYFNIGPAASMIDRFFPQRPGWSIALFTLCALGSVVFLLIFGRSFSELKERLPRWDKYMLFVIVLYTMFFGYQFINALFEPYSFSPVTFFLVFVLMTPLAVRFLTGRHRMAKIFAAGVLWFLFWNIVGILQQVGALPFELPFIPWTVGQVGLLMIYALGLGYKIMENERQKAQADRIRELDAVKSRFFANISHEFRTPLSLILGPVSQAMESIPASETLEDTDEVPVKGRHLKVMKRNALRLQNLVDQLLDLSKLDSGKMKLAVAEGRLIPFIRSIVFSFESLAERKHIHFSTHFSSGPETAWFDRDKLEKILVNLLSNAFKFTPEHGTITVKIEGLDGRVRIQVSDSGPGMPAEEADKIFDRFYQVEGTEAQGTGIGLALVKELVDLHGGQISVESVRGEGATFKVTLPCRKEDFALEHLVATATDTPDHVEPALLTGLDTEVSENGEKDGASADDHPLALVVEDNPDLRHYISENITGDYQVIVAVDGQEGLDLALERVPDIIISDVMMPRKNGFELCTALKTDDHTSHIPIILLTAKAGRGDKIEGLEQGADDYLTKPFDARELRVRMANLIDQRRRLRERFSGELKIRPTGVTLNSVDERFVKQVMACIEENLGNEFYSVEELARSVGFSRSQLHRKLKALADKSPNQLIREFRLTRAKELLEQRAASVSEIAYEVGYSNVSYFSKSYKDMFGLSPSETGSR